MSDPLELPTSPLSSRSLFPLSSTSSFPLPTLFLPPPPIFPFTLPSLLPLFIYPFYPSPFPLSLLPSPLQFSLLPLLPNPPLVTATVNISLWDLDRIWGIAAEEEVSLSPGGMEVGGEAGETRGGCGTA